MPKTFVKTPLLNNYMYDLCYNLPTDIVKTLPIKYRRILFSQQSTKGFCEKSTIDEKLHFFHLIGLTNSLTIFPETIKGKNQTKEFFKKYEENKLAGAQKDHAILNIHVSTDKETSHLMGLMAMNLSAKGYRMNLDYNKTAFHLKGWNKRLITAEGTLFDETIESADLIVKTMLNTIDSIDRVELLHEIGQMDMKVLLFLYLNRSRYVSKEYIWSFFITATTKGKVTSSIKRVMQDGYIRKHIDWRNLKYTITSKGEDMVYSFIKRILKLNNFDND